MLSLFDAVEADFLRDYGINLEEQIDAMTWRRFLTLTRNLSPYGAVAIRVQAMEAEQPPSSGEKAAEAFFTSVVSV